MLRVGELAERAGMNAWTVRFYERRGLLTASRSASGYRIFGDDAVETIAFIREAQKLGLTLAEVGEIIAIRRGGRKPCKHVRRLLEQRIDQVTREFEALNRLKTTLEDRLAWVQAHPDPACDEEVGCVYVGPKPYTGARS